MYNLKSDPFYFTLESNLFKDVCTIYYQIIIHGVVEKGVILVTKSRWLFEHVFLYIILAFDNTDWFSCEISFKYIFQSWNKWSRPIRVVWGNIQNIRRSKVILKMAAF